MRLGKLAAAAAVLSLMATPALAAPGNPAASLSVGKSIRTGSVKAKSSRLAGTSIVYVVVLLAAVVGLGFVAADGDDDSDSN